MTITVEDGVKTYLIDLGERVAGTYIAALLGLLLADGFDWTSLPAWKAAALAAAPAGITVIKGAIGSFVGDPTSAAILPRRTE